VLLQIGDPANIDLVRQLVQAHAYWRSKGLAVDLVILNEDRIGYRQHLQDEIIGLIATGTEAHVADRPGGIFVRSAEQVSHEDRILLQAVARVVISDSRGSFAEQVNRRSLVDRSLALLAPIRSSRPPPVVTSSAPPPDLILANDLGGFTPDGREYVITTTQGQLTPNPWVNVIANPGFGLAQSVYDVDGNTYTTPPYPEAKRDYDSLEFVWNKLLANNWSLRTSYMWSRLYGNYSGLSQSDENGRTSPNVGRAFDYRSEEHTSELQSRPSS
jgi:cellobiose phosphorylase